MQIRALAAERMNCRILQLTDFNLAKLAVVKETVLWLDGQDHSRWVLKTQMKSEGRSREELYLKIWNPTYIRRDNILAGIDVGFYDRQTTPALTGLIFHQGICRGYATNKCTRYWRRPWEERFYNLIQEKSAKTGYFSYQFSPYHVLRYRNQPSLVDLEGIYRLSELPALPIFHGHFDDVKYERYVTDLYNERYNSHIETRCAQVAGNETIGRPKPFLQRIVKFLWEQSMAYIKQRVNPNHVYLIQK